jgi:hypothetical protein
MRFYTKPKPMRKKYFLLVIVLFVSSTTFSQNNQINPPVQINNEQQINATANQQTVALSNNNMPGNNPPVANIYPQQAVQQQVQTNMGNKNEGTIVIKTGNRTISSSTFSSPSKSHSMKLKLHLNKIHIARRFFHNFPLFQSKTYKHIFTSKKRSIKHCFRF